MSLSALGSVMWWGLGLASTPAPTPSQGPDPTSVSPGLIGFLVTFALVAVCLLLFTSMVRRLRRMQYRAEHEATDELVGNAPAEGDSRTGTGQGRQPSQQAQADDDPESPSDESPSDESPSDHPAGRDTP